MLVAPTVKASAQKMVKLLDRAMAMRLGSKWVLLRAWLWALKSAPTSGAT